MARNIKKHKKLALLMKDDDIDLNPLIDVITMLIIFFILGGKMSQDIRVADITVPPTKTATKLEDEPEWQRLIVNVFGNTQTSKGEPTLKIKVGNNEYVSEGIDNFNAYIKLRDLLDRTYIREANDNRLMDDPKGTGMRLPKWVIELRADSNTQYRVIQEIQQVITDSINPSDGMKPHLVSPKDLKPFVNINFTSRIPGVENPGH
jgi:biopolymer transport protein ExbD